jgi:hypothetical protein
MALKHDQPNAQIDQMPQDFSEFLKLLNAHRRD